MNPTARVNQEMKRADALVGKAFVQLPGKPEQHRVLFEDAKGQKYRVRDIEMVWNDGLLMDAIKGLGSYRSGCEPGSNNLIALAKAEELYGARLEDAVSTWLAFPNTVDEWPQVVN